MYDCSAERPLWRSRPLRLIRAGAAAVAAGDDRREPRRWRRQPLRPARRIRRRAAEQRRLRRRRICARMPELLWRAVDRRAHAVNGRAHPTAVVDARPRQSRRDGGLSRRRADSAFDIQAATRCGARPGRVWGRAYELPAVGRGRRDGHGHGHWREEWRVRHAGSRSDAGHGHGGHAARHGPVGSHARRIAEPDAGHARAVRRDGRARRTRELLRSALCAAFEPPVVSRLSAGRAIVSERSKVRQPLLAQTRFSRAGPNDVQVALTWSDRAEHRLEQRPDAVCAQRGGADALTVVRAHLQAHDGVRDGHRLSRAEARHLLKSERV
mmetsp:Transcript_905/g.2863  ORF Transcript_905/g.2863 Transcript_905/m.2863 type:complete len:325 (+) Transcript_905:624-1598(+)